MYDNNNYPYENSATDSTSAGQTSASRTAAGNTPQPGGYYHSTYSDGNYGQNFLGSPYENRTGSYPYNNIYPNGYSQMNRNTDSNKDKKTEKKRSGGGYLKKALISVSLGLFFGLFAGIGFYAVQSVTAMFGGDTKQENITEVEAVGGEVVNETVNTDTDEEDIEKTDVEAKTESGIHVTDSVTSVVSDVSGVVKEVMPAIVSIDNHYAETFSYFGQSFTNEADATGSGIIVGENDTELLIVTNYHVIADTEGLTVQFVEGSEIAASVKGTDPDMDLAVIAVPLSEIDSETRQQIAIATLGDSDALEVGEPAIAIGNSLGYGQSVTTGVISALNRNISLSNGSDGTFIQTDAAINPGNSGGALLNMKGEVIGINSNKIGGSVVEGMGYAIPISSASPIIADLMLKETKNKVAVEERGYLGISGISVTPEVSRAYGIPEGVFISQIYENTAAYEAGLQQGDIITVFDGEEISSMDELQRELEYYAKGDTVAVTIMRATSNGYESREVQMTLGSKVQN